MEKFASTSMAKEMAVTKVIVARKECVRIICRIIETENGAMNSILKEGIINECSTSHPCRSWPWL